MSLKFQCSPCDFGFLLDGGGGVPLPSKKNCLPPGVCPILMPKGHYFTIRTPPSSLSTTPSPPIPNAVPERSPKEEAEWAALLARAFLSPLVSPPKISPWIARRSPSPTNAAGAGPQQMPQQAPVPAAPPGYAYLDTAAHLCRVRNDNSGRPIGEVQRDTNYWAERARAPISHGEMVEAGRMAAHLQQSVEEMKREQAERAANARMWGR